MQFTQPRALSSIKRIIQLSNPSFWKENPALFYSLSLLIGTSAPLFFGHYLWVCLWCLYLILHRAYPQMLLLIASIFYGLSSQLPTDFETKEVVGIFSPTSVALHQTPFNKQLHYKGTFLLDGKKLPCSIYSTRKKGAPKANKNYMVEGKLTRRGYTDFMLKPKSWDAIPSSWSLAELRYKTKTAFKKTLSKNLASKRAHEFISAIATGEGADRLLRYEFARVGLQHILAISGFHFGILIAFLSYIFRFFLSRVWKIGALFVILSLYYVFIGSSASVERSYLTALFYLISKWISRPTSGINLLGVAAGIELIFNPLIASNIGFQLSFLSCFAILLFFPIVEQVLQRFLPKKSKSEIEALTVLDQHGYILSSFFRKIISLNLAISLVLIPLLLFHFHQFPLLSFVYNLFVPTCVGVIMVFFLLALVFSVLFAPLGACFYWITSKSTEFLLDIISNPPLAIDVSLYATNIPAWGVIGYLFFLGFFGIAWKSKSREFALLTG